MTFDVKALPYLILPAEDDRFDGTYRHPGDLADLAMGHAEAVGHDHHRALFLVQHREELVQVARLLEGRRRHRFRVGRLARGIENLPVTRRASLRLQEGCVRDPEQPAAEGPLAAESVQPVPRVDEAVLGQVVGQVRVARQAAQEAADARLVSPDELAVGMRVDLRDGPGDELQVVRLAEPGCRFQCDACVSPNRHMTR